MNRQISLYLDFIRFSAAMLVFISHVPSFAGGWLWQFSGFGHEAVVIFFVLSGFVIAYVVFDRKESALKYTVSRLTRIYSVAIPALLITFALYYVGQEINPGAFSVINDRLEDPLRTVITALTFTNQSWVATPTLSNLPYWSLGYEVLYYVFFGVLVYSRASKRIMLLFIVCLLMGPSILLYLPIWFAGVCCFKYLNHFKISFRLSLVLYLLSVIGIVTFSLESIQLPLNEFAYRNLGDAFYGFLLEPAEMFTSDYILAVFVTLHIFSSYHLTKEKDVFTIHKTVESIIKSLSSHTFAIYLFHMPMLFFISAIVPYQTNPALNMLFCWFVVPIVIIWISIYTEKKKYHYKMFFENILVRSDLFKTNERYRN